MRHGIYGCGILHKALHVKKNLSATSGICFYKDPYTVRQALCLATPAYGPYPGTRCLAKAGVNLMCLTKAGRNFLALTKAGGKSVLTKVGKNSYWTDQGK